MEIEVQRGDLKTKEDYKRYKMYLHELMLDKQMREARRNGSSG